MRLEDLTKDVCKKFKEVVKDEWLDNNFNYIKKTFRKSTKKYDNKEYYNIYLLMITIMKQLLGSNIVKKCKYSKEQIYYFTYVNVYIETTCEFLR